LFNYTTSLRKSTQDRFPLEPNAAPQIVLGLYDGRGSGPSSGSNDEDAAEQRGAIALALGELKASYGSSQHDRVCTLLALGVAQDSFSDDVLHVTVGELETFRLAMQSISRSYILRIRQLSTSLSDIEFSNQGASASSEHGLHRLADGEAAASAEQGTPQDQGNASQSAVSTSEVSNQT
jgi:hypothetical protein